MRRGSTAALALVITLAAPLIALGTTTLFVVQPWIVGAVYATPGFPDDPFGMPGSERAELAREGVRAVAAIGPGADSLAAARLPGGSPAFTAGEIEHMRDVHDLVTLIAVAWLAALAAAAIAAFSLRRTGHSGVARTAAARGAILTIAAIAALGLAMILDFDSVFTGFHELFFEEGTWTFASEQTLIRLYPERFWSVAAVIAAGLTVLQAVAAWYLFAGRNRNEPRRSRVR